MHLHLDKRHRSPRRVCELHLLLPSLSPVSDVLRGLQVPGDTASVPD
jgi:hypothetical protein